MKENQRYALSTERVPFPQGLRAWWRFFLVWTLGFVLALGGMLILPFLFSKESQAYSLLLQRMLSLCTTVSAFGIPACLWLHWHHTSLRQEPILKTPAMWGLCLLALCASLPVVGGLAWLNELFPIPDWCKSYEDMNERVLKSWLADRSVSAFLQNLLVMVLAPAVCEELFFRGVLQRLLVKQMQRLHLGVWIGALVFSLLHFSLSGLLPRLLMGAILGYLYAFTGWLGPSILFHLLNNAMVVVGSYLWSYDAMQTPIDSLGWASLVGVGLGSLLLVWVGRKLIQLRTKQLI